MQGWSDPSYYAYECSQQWWHQNPDLPDLLTLGEALHSTTTREPKLAPKEKRTSPATEPHIRDSAVSPPCDRPRRQPLPPKPTQLPFPATEGSQQCLKQWLLNYYESSTFTTCEHQPLPLMKGAAMRLMLDPNAEQWPATHILVPLHW